MVFSLNDFFCGCGGFGLGFKQEGLNIVGAWDWDKYACKSYSENIDHKVQLTDIAQLKYNDLPKADIWSFGFPCQDISIAGKQAGMIKGETRSGLFYEIIRLLEETKLNNYEMMPKVLLAENVKAVEKYLPEIGKEYERQGYKLYYKLFNSKFWNVPQNRERYFMVGIHKNLCQNFTFPDEQYTFIPKIKNILEEIVSESHFIRDSRWNKIKELTNKIHIANENKIIIIGNTQPSGRGINGWVYHSEGIAPTLTTNKSEAIKIFHKDELRRLTVRETARLQGFPDDYRFVVSNSQIIKQMGNAVTVTISKAIAHQIKSFLEMNMR